MKSTHLKTSIIAFCLLAGLLMVGMVAEAADPNPKPTENCWYAGITVYCHSYYSTQCSDGTFDESCRHLVLGPSNGWGRGGGPTAETCNEALHSLLIDAAYAGCRVQEGSPACRPSTGACIAPLPDDPPSDN